MTMKHIITLAMDDAIGAWKGKEAPVREELDAAEQVLFLRVNMACWLYLEGGSGSSGSSKAVGALTYDVSGWPKRN